MTAVKRNASQASQREFVGKAWMNKVDKVGSPNNGVEYVNVTLDRDIETVTMSQGDKLLLWPNKKRDGKKDADFRVSLVHATA